MQKEEQPFVPNRHLLVFYSCEDPSSLLSPFISLPFGLNLNKYTYFFGLHKLPFFISCSLSNLIFSIYAVLFENASSVSKNICASMSQRDRVGVKKEKEL